MSTSPASTARMASFATGARSASRCCARASSPSRPVRCSARHGGERGTGLRRTAISARRCRAGTPQPRTAPRPRAGRVAVSRQFAEQRRYLPFVLTDAGLGELDGDLGAVDGVVFVVAEQLDSFADLCLGVAERPVGHGRLLAATYPRSCTTGLSVTG